MYERGDEMIEFSADSAAGSLGHDAVADERDLRIALTGASGYVGGRLAPRLLEAGCHVRCLARSPTKLVDRLWASHPNATLMAHDLADASDEAAEQRVAVLRDCDVAYYLVHSMISAGADYARQDRMMAERFATAASEAGVSRIVYLGGMGEMGAGLSEHLRSRREVEEALASTGVPVTVFRAAMIIGSGSASFEILRYLVQRLPIMITPRWVHTDCQPIAIRNVVGYLQQCLTTPETIGGTFDIGGPDVMSYRAIMDIMAEESGLMKRWIIPVPVLTPRLSSLWIHVVTPVSGRIARPLAEGLRNRVVCGNDRAARIMPQDLLTVREAIRAAMGRMQDHTVETTWTAAGVVPGDPDWAGGTVFTDQRETVVQASASEVYRAVCRVGGGHGWYAADWLWRVRGVMDRLVGGPGLRRGRRDPEQVSYGEALDFWRVVGVEPERELRLRAEMKLPGEAELMFTIEEDGDDASVCRLKQTARFRPRGLLGLLYWYAVLPLHGIVFRGMLNGIRRAAERVSASSAPDD